jgi:hypothetical protein
MRWLRYWPLFPLLLAPIAVVAAFLPHDDKPLLTTPEAWRVVGDFGLGQPDPADRYTEIVDSVYWLAKRFHGDGSGTIVSRPFEAPPWIGLTVTGDLTRPENVIYFRLEEDGKRFPVRVRTGEDAWRRLTFGLPSAWVGKQIRLVVEAGRRGPHNTFGLSNPRAIGSASLLASQLVSLRLLAMFALSLVLFLLPGLPVAARLARRGTVQPDFVVPVAIVVSCVAGYLAFWAYFLHPRVGLVFGGAVLLAGAAASAIDLSRHRTLRSVLFSDEVVTPLTLMALAGLFYLALLHAVTLGIADLMQPRLRFLEFPLALDNELPFFFAESLYKGLDPREIVSGWHSSDRPPLQAGLTLLQMPFSFLAREPREYALLAGCAFQCAWVPAVWALWRFAKLPRRRAGLALLFVVLTGFALINTVFTWPKLLAAALCVFTVTTAVFSRVRGEPVALRKAVFLGLSAALAFLSHGGVAFTLLPLGLLLLLPPYYPGLSRLLVSGLVFVATACPWLCYQTYYDPPGNKLIRQHLAGDSPEWRDDRSLPHNLLNAYAARAPGSVLQKKLANVRTLFAAARDQYPWPPNETPPEWPADAVSYRRCEFMALFWSLGLLNLGWVVAFVKLWRRRSELDFGLGVVAPALGVASVLVWVVLMFGPGSTVVHQGSYATFLLLFASLAAWVATLPTLPAHTLLTLHGGVFAYAWMLTSPANAYGVPNVLMILFALYCFAAMAKTALRVTPAEIATVKEELASRIRTNPIRP